MPSTARRARIIVTASTNYSRSTSVLSSDEHAIQVPYATELSAPVPSIHRSLGRSTSCAEDDPNLGAEQDGDDRIAP